MFETLELRVDEEKAGLVFGPEEGLSLGSGLVRKIEMRLDDPRLGTVCRLERELHAAGESPLFLGWCIKRHYSSKELAQAELLCAWISAVFEPAGEETRTVYDEKDACPLCGAGRRQVGDLTLDIRRIPKRADFAQTIAEEMVVSARMVAELERTAATGLELRDVRSKSKGHPITADWKQLWVVSRPVEVVQATKYGIDPCNPHTPGEHRCPLGHTLGLNLLSELHIERSSWDGSDFCLTRQLVGVKRGLLRPRPSLLVSQRTYQHLMRVKARGIKIEVVHLH